MLTAEDINNIQVLLNRVDLKGNEATTVAGIILKLQMLHSQFENEESNKESNEETKK
jgi:hypothetical protein